MSKHSKKYRKVRNKISRMRKNKKYAWQRIKDKNKRAEAKAKFDAELITFNRPQHPSTKFKNVIDYAEIQKQMYKKSPS